MNVWWDETPALLGHAAELRERIREMADSSSKVRGPGITPAQARLDEAVSVLTRKVADLEKHIAVVDANAVRTEALTQAVTLYWRKRRHPNPDRVANAAARFAAFLNTGH